jgi:hypothetical protein
MEANQGSATADSGFSSIKLSRGTFTYTVPVPQAAKAGPYGSLLFQGCLEGGLVPEVFLPQVWNTNGQPVAVALGVVPGSWTLNGGVGTSVGTIQVQISLPLLHLRPCTLSVSGVSPKAIGPTTIPLGSGEAVWARFAAGTFTTTFQVNQFIDSFQGTVKSAFPSLPGCTITEGTVNAPTATPIAGIPGRPAAFRVNNGISAFVQSVELTASIPLGQQCSLSAVAFNNSNIAIDPGVGTVPVGTVPPVPGGTVPVGTVPPVPGGTVPVGTVPPLPPGGTVPLGTAPPVPRGN